MGPRATLEKRYLAKAPGISGLCGWVEMDPLREMGYIRSVPPSGARRVDRQMFSTTGDQAIRWATAGTTSSPQCPWWWAPRRETHGIAGGFTGWSLAPKSSRSPHPIPISVLPLSTRRNSGEGPVLCPVPLKASAPQGWEMNFPQAWSQVWRDRKRLLAQPSP